MKHKYINSYDFIKKTSFEEFKSLKYCFSSNHKNCRELIQLKLVDYTVERYLNSYYFYEAQYQIKNKIFTILRRQFPWKSFTYIVKNELQIKKRVSKNYKNLTIIQLFKGLINIKKTKELEELIINNFNAREQKYLLSLNLISYYKESENDKNQNN